MYIINYENGGFIIVSATKNYYPILAYSEKNIFHADENMYGIVGWMEEVQSEMREIDIQNEEVLFDVTNMWKQYEEHEDNMYSNLTVRSSSEESHAYITRLSELRTQYYSYGYMYYRLSDVLDLNLLPTEISSNIRNMANDIGSPHEYTIVGIKNEYEHQSVGPLLTTNWHQNSPYNSVCNSKGHPAGCGAIAMAQIMNYHKHPSSLTYNGYSINWNNMSYSAPFLVAAAGHALGTVYTSAGSAVLPSKVDNAFRSMLYEVSDRDYDSHAVKNEILLQRRPVMMFGSPNKFYINSHYWVCDGAKESISTVKYFAEYRIGGPGYYSYCNPGGPVGEHPGAFTSVLFQFHMNWGWGGSCDGWYIDSNVNTSNGNYSHLSPTSTQKTFFTVFYV